MINIPFLITTDQLSKLLNENPASTRRRRVTGDGPPFVQIGNSRQVRYRLTDVEAWMAGLATRGRTLNKRGRPRKAAGHAEQSK